MVLNIVNQSFKSKSNLSVEFQFSYGTSTKSPAHAYFYEGIFTMKQTSSKHQANDVCSILPRVCFTVA